MKGTVLANLVAPRCLRMTTGPSQMAYRQHGKYHHQRRSLPGSLIQIQIQRRTLVSRRSSRTLTTPRPYETVTQPGNTSIPQGQREKESFSPSLNTVSTPVCQTVCSSRHAAAFQVGTRGPDVAGAIEEHIAGKWHIIALQEAIEYLQHECLMNHFFITPGFAILTLFCGHGFLPSRLL